MCDSSVPSLQDSALEGMPDTAQTIWRGGDLADADPAKGKAKAKPKKEDEPPPPDNKPKFGLKRLGLTLGEPVLREIICALLEGSGPGETA